MNGFCRNFDSDRTIVLDDDPADWLASANRQIRPSLRRPKVGDGGAAASAVMICHLIKSRAHLSLPIEVWVVRQTVVLTGFWTKAFASGCV